MVTRWPGSPGSTETHSAPLSAVLGKFQNPDSINETADERRDKVRKKTTGPTRRRLPASSARLAGSRPPMSSWQHVLRCEYAVHGEIAIHAQILFCNIRNPQSFGQKSITFFRFLHFVIIQICWSERKLNHCSVLMLLLRQRKSFAQIPGGATRKYSHSQGIKGPHDEIAAGIVSRDGFPASADDIF
ncbi:hypothetical protein ABZP36_019968 [Zizania latifolia]